jgi:hypothetical protein
VSRKEATARIKINKLLETAGWRFFGEGIRSLKAMTSQRSRDQQVNMKLEAFMPALLDKALRGELQ